MPRRTRKSDAALLELRAFGLAYPGAHVKSPWPGHHDLAVNDKTFAYMSLEGEPLSIGCKLPRSAHVALMLPFVEPMAYGLGKSGWVAAKPPEDQPIPIDMFKEWLDESYRAQAPKKLVAQIGAVPAAKVPAKKKAASARKPANKTRKRARAAAAR